VFGRIDPFNLTARHIDEGALFGAEHVDIDCQLLLMGLSEWRAMSLTRS
jgi:hypothetical protein